jgi:hypothetical protein
MGGGDDDQAEDLAADERGLHGLNQLMHPFKSKQFCFANLRKSVFICGSFLVFLPTGGVALAQRGGKAEPNRIEFKRGTTSTTISGTVRGDEQAEYVLSAKKGQRLIIKLTSAPVKSSVFQILGENNDTLGLEYDANFSYSGVLPKTGDYFINVKRPTEAKGTSRYKLTVTVR